MLCMLLYTGNGRRKRGKGRESFFLGGGGGGAPSLDITHNGIKFKLLDITVYIQGMENRGRERGRGVGGGGTERQEEGE